MRTITRATAGLLAAVSLAACAGPTTLTYPARHAQRLATSNSMLGEACDGHDVSHSLRLSGHTYLTADFDVRRVVFGSEVPFAHVSGPVTKGVSQMALPVYSGSRGPEACSGAAVRTIVRRENGAVYLDWVLELAPGSSVADLRPTESWKVGGRTPVADDGYATDAVAFEADGKQMIARLRVMPGAVWVAFQNKERADAYEAAHPGPAFAAPLPDERPGRTLDDVTDPEFKK